MGNDNKVAGTALHWSDVLVIALYFVIVLAVGYWSACYKHVRESVDGYFLAGRRMHWILVGASLFASNVGTGLFIGIAGSAAASGIAVVGFEWNAAFILILLGWIFVPVYIASGVLTMPEYLMKRFGGQRIRVYISCLSLMMYIFIRISADLYAGAIFVKLMLGWNLYSSILILVIIAAVLTAIGGLMAVIWTDAIQVVIMLLGAVILMIISLQRVGGYENLIVDYFKAVPRNKSFIVPGTNCHIPPANAMNIFRAADEQTLPWIGMTFGLTIIATWHWCTDQLIVQRTLAATNFSHAKAGCIFAALLKLLPMWLIVLPGMAARVLYPDEVGCTNPDACERICGNRLGCTNIAYPMLVVQEMPNGIRGLMLACMMSALMSNLTSIFNSSATLFTIDVWKALIRKNASTLEQLIIGKVFVALLVLVSILWIPVIQNASDSRLFDYVQAVTSYLAPPICAIFVLAVFVPRVNEPGAFWGLMVGLLVGMIRFAVYFVFPSSECSQNLHSSPDIIVKLHYLHFAIVLFFITIIVSVSISYLFKPPEPDKLSRLTFWTRHEESNVNIECIRQTDHDIGTSNINSESPKISLWKYALQVVCGVNLKQMQGESDHEKEDSAKQTFFSIKENENQMRILNIWAVLILSVTIFCYAFYA